MCHPALSQSPKAVGIFVLLQNGILYVKIISNCKKKKKKERKTRFLFFSLFDHILSEISKLHYLLSRTSQVVLVVKNLPPNAGDIRDAGLIPGSRRSSGGGHGNPLQYS